MAIKQTLVYEIYPWAWPKGCSDVINFIECIKELDVDYIRLDSIFASPMHNHGDDISNHRAINPLFGTVDDVRELVEFAHRKGIGVILEFNLNQTSKNHKWFLFNKNYYCWDNYDHPKWRNLFDGESAWRFDYDEKRFYLSLFHEEQADLNWFPNQKLNQSLASEMRQNIEFYLQKFNVDGFHLSNPQWINKNIYQTSFDPESIYKASQKPAIEVINSILQGKENLFLSMDCIDPTFGSIASEYIEKTPVNFYTNSCVRDAIDISEEEFEKAIALSVKDPHFILNLEDKNSIRFPSRGMDPYDVISTMFESGAQSIGLYEGGELGLKNPSREELSDYKMSSLDARTRSLYKNGVSLDELRPTSSANVRIPISMEEYKAQFNSPTSCLNWIKEGVKYWRSR